MNPLSQLAPIRSLSALLPLALLLGFRIGANQVNAQSIESGAVGYLTVTIPGATSADQPAEMPISFPFAGKIEAAGQLDAVADQSVTDNEVNFSAILGSFSPGAFYLQSQESASDGHIYPILAANGSTLTISSAESPISPFSRYFIVRTTTLQDVLPPQSTSLLAGLTAAESDVLVIWDAATQSQQRYFIYDDGQGVREWRRRDEGNDSYNTLPLAPGQGALVLRRSLAWTNLILAGRVTRPPKIKIHQGVNLVATPYFGVRFADSRFIQSLPIQNEAASSSTLTFPDYSQPDRRRGPFYLTLGEFGPQWMEVGTGLASTEQLANFIIPMATAMRYVNKGPAFFARIDEPTNVELSYGVAPDIGFSFSGITLSWRPPPTLNSQVILESSVDGLAWLMESFLDAPPAGQPLMVQLPLPFTPRKLFRFRSL